MKALIMVTGRGMGGDAVTAINISKALTKKGVECEFALDHNAPGLLLQKNGLSWHKLKIPQAGGHAATKFTLTKAGIKTSFALLEAIILIKKVKPDVIVGVIGGGAIIACMSSKLSRLPGVGVINTPADTKICSRLNANIVLPESHLFEQTKESNNYQCYYPLDPDIVKGDKEKALKKMPEIFNFEKPTIIFSSGSTLFEKMAKSALKISQGELKVNIVLVGHPINEDILKLLKGTNIIYLGYVDWIQDLFKLADVAVLSGDGVMINEAIACKVPIVAVSGIKYGRYHNMARVFPGAVVETSIENLEEILKQSLSNIDSMKEEAQKYGLEVLSSADRIANIIIKEAEKVKK